jgi:hypothetical protein
LKVCVPRTRGPRNHPKEERLKKLALALAATAALVFTAPAFVATASAQDGMHSRNVKKVVIIKRGHHDRGRHLGWRNRDRHHGNKVVIIKKHYH